MREILRLIHVALTALQTLFGTAADTDIATDIANVQAEVDKIGTPTDTDIATDIANVQTDATAIKAVTDLLPDAGALTSLAQEATLGVPNGGSIAGDINLVNLLVTPTKVGGSISYTDAGGEQDIIEIISVAADKATIQGIYLDLSEITQNGVIKVYSKIDGTNYVQVGGDIAFTVATDNDGLQIVPFIHGLSRDFKITYTEGADETADRTINFTYVLV
jgi:hypothetical protein